MVDTQSLASSMGWASVTCWILVYSPQFYENYINQSGEGISVYFILIWMIGDVTNLIGSWQQHLLPTMVILALYYTLCDIVLFSQIVYYRPKSRGLGQPKRALSPIRPQESTGIVPSERDALLPIVTVDRELQHGNLNEFSCKNRLGSALKHISSGPGSFMAAYFSIFVIGSIGYFVSKSRTIHPKPGTLPPPDGLPEEEWHTGAQVMGWISAVAYLGSRLPQMLKNMQTKCNGFSLLFVVLGITGNLTFFASILLVSRDSLHIWINLSWIVGSVGTILLDLIVLFQFWIYRHDRCNVVTCANLPEA